MVGQSVIALLVRVLDMNLRSVNRKNAVGVKMLITRFINGNLCYGFKMREMASVEMLLNQNDQPGVRISATDEFMELLPIQRVGLLIAAIQLCGVAISAVVSDNPDDEIEIRELLESVAISPMQQDLN